MLLCLLIGGLSAFFTYIAVRKPAPHYICEVGTDYPLVCSSIEEGACGVTLRGCDGGFTFYCLSEIACREVYGVEPEQGLLPDEPSPT